MARNDLSSLFNCLDVKQYEKDGLHFSRRLESIWGSQIDKFDPCSGLVNLGLFYTKYEVN